MRDPIKVTREQWDAAFERLGKYCGDPDDAWHEVEMILGPRPGPDTPPDLRDHDDRIVAQVDPEDRDAVWMNTGNYRLLLPWLEDHLLPWLREQVEEARDDA